MKDNLKLTKDQVAKLAAYSALTSRMELMARAGIQYGGDRDIYQALGYKTSLVFRDYQAQYERQDIAKAVINRPVEATWCGNIGVVESNKEDETEFEKAWKELVAKFHLKAKFVRLDKLATLGRYGILLIGLDDVKKPDDFMQPVSQGKRTLMYVKPLSQGNATISTWEEDTNNERYGQPKIYDITIQQPSGNGESEVMSSRTVKIHHSRVIHVPGELLESEVLGVPALQAIFNRLQDLEKLVGASAEMFWRGARPGYKGKVDKEFNLTQSAKSELQDQIDEYEHNMRRFLLTEGIDIGAMEMQVADPRWHVDVQLQMISAVTGIPKRILVGSERGELASSEDKSSWLELIQNRQKDYAEDQIVRPFIQFCVDYGILPAPADDYTIEWQDVFAPSEKERAEIGQIRASALQSYMNNALAETVVPVDVFIQYMLGLSAGDIEYVKELYKSAEADSLAKLRAQLAAATAKPISASQGGNSQSSSTAQDSKQETKTN